MSHNASIVSQPLLSEPERLRMLELHRRYFDNVRREAFLSDMAAKDWVIVLRDETGGIVGFSTVRFVTLAVDGTDCLFIFSGDTVVDRLHRQRGLLAGAFGHMMVRAIETFPHTARYWFLISKGYRTYRYLPLYFRHYYPGCTAPTPPRVRRLLTAVGKHLFGNAYDAQAGIVRHAGVGDRLTPGACDVPDGRANDPHVRFFAARNPNYAQGDELACIAEVTYDNFNRSCLRLIERTNVEWVETDGSCGARIDAPPRTITDTPLAHTRSDRPVPGTCSHER